MTVNYACTFGRIRLVLYDDLTDCGVADGGLAGPEQLFARTLSPGVCTGFKGMSRPSALVANLATNPLVRRGLRGSIRSATTFRPSWDVSHH